MNLLYKIAASAGNPSLAPGNTRTWNKEGVMGGKQWFNAAVPVLPVH